MAVTKPVPRPKSSRLLKENERPTWTFLTNHAHVLVCLTEDQHARIRDIAARVGITERGVQRIITELEEGGYLTHVRDGRRNVYRIDADQRLRHPLERHNTVASLLRLASSMAR